MRRPIIPIQKIKVCIFQSLLLPACSPELDPVEPWFEELRAVLSNEVFDTIEAMATS